MNALRAFFELDKLGTSIQQEITAGLTTFVTMAYIIIVNPIAAGFVKSQELWRYSDYQEWIDMKPFRFGGKVLRDLYFDNAKRYKELMKAYEQ
jgi:hypothetical protein